MSPLLWIGGAVAAAYYLMPKKTAAKKGPGGGVYQMVVRYHQPLTEPQLQSIRDAYSKYLEDEGMGELYNVQQVGHDVRIDVKFNMTPPIEPKVQPFSIGDAHGTLISINKIA